MSMIDENQDSYFVVLCKYMIDTRFIRNDIFEEKKPLEFTFCGSQKGLFLVVPNP